ncbi:MAG: HIT domain-containing protein [Puniceicoccales bacterium]|jgi:histidine triad (HIT) family protein|nr:HIT domain-containing protein [Puniceicoccales bacterium]
MEDKTIFEKIIDGEVPSEILYEDAIAIVIRDIDPQAPTHALIVPKKRISRIAEAEEEDAVLLGKLLLAAKKFAKANGLDSFRLVINSGHQAGETVPHLHIHLLAGRPMAWPPG